MARRDALPIHPRPDDQRLPDGEPGAVRLTGLCARPGMLSETELHELPRQRLAEPFACEEGWSVDGLAWEGVPLREIVARGGPLPEARYLRVYAGDYWLALPLAGLEPDDISVEVTPASHLIIRARQRGELKGLKTELLNEWNAGDAEREIELPVAVDGKLANVTYGNGVLVVALPIAAKTRAAKLSLKALTPTRGLHAGNMGRPIRPYARARA